ncbi:MAG: hypothetical protein FWG87_05140 [Defluviitaleaceae bacterium]|nr:hypothetical protein [Defluviitaleaceae bacterium]
MQDCDNLYVGDGFIRPEITSFCVNGRYPARIDERAYLGTDGVGVRCCLRKPLRQHLTACLSVPYKKHGNRTKPKCVN